MKAKKIAAWMLSIAMLMTSTMPAFATVDSNDLESGIILESNDIDELDDLLIATGSNPMKDDQKGEELPEISDPDEPDDLLKATDSNSIKDDQKDEELPEISGPDEQDEPDDLPKATDSNAIQNGQNSNASAPGQVEQEGTEIYFEFEGYLDIEDMPDADELAAGFIEKLMYQYEDVSVFGNYGEADFGPIKSHLYQGLKKEVTAIANGESTNTLITISLDKKWTESELKAGSLKDLNENDQKFQEMFGLTGDMILDVLRRLLYNCPYEFYWYDKGQPLALGAQYDYKIYKDAEEPYVETVGDVQLVLAVSKAYQNEDGTINGDKIRAAGTAAENARKLVINDSSLSDYEKMLQYKQKICELTEYDYDAMAGTTIVYGDPWQIVYVFDGDPDTNVVCEGYSKAFQYLCDMSGLTCYTVTGMMGDIAHMWNIVTLNGKNYHVDITNCDGNYEVDGSATMGYPDKLFVTGATGSVKDGYTINFVAINGADFSVPYWYEELMKSIYSHDILTLQPEFYIKSQTGKTAVRIPGEEVVLTIEAGEASSYQWFYKAAESAEPVAIDTESNEYEIGSAESGGKLVSTLRFDMTEDKVNCQYLCKVTNELGQERSTDWIRIADTGWKKDGDAWYRYENGVMLTSKFFTVTENDKTGTYYANSDGKLAIGFIEQPKDQNGLNGETVKFTVEVSEVLEEERTYQWYCSADGGANWKKVEDDTSYHGAKSSALEVKVNNYQRTLQFCCEIGAEGYDPVISDAVKIVGTNYGETDSNDYTDSSDSTSSNDKSGMTSDSSAGIAKPATETEVYVAANGTTVSTTGSTKDKSGTVIGLVVGHKTPTGETAVSNGTGGVTLGNVSVHFADGAAETAGLPKDVVDKIERLNKGASVNEVLTAEMGLDLSLYSKLGNTRAVIAYDHTTQLTKTGTELILHVSAVEGFEIAAVYYDNNTGRWVFVPVAVDPITKTVKLYVPGSCTLQLLRKN